MMYMETLTTIAEAAQDGFELIAYDSLSPIFVRQFGGMVVTNDPLSRFCVEKWGCKIGDPLPVERLKKLEFIMELVKMEESKWCLTGIREAPAREEPLEAAV